MSRLVISVRNFNDEDARLYNEAIHHLIYTTNDLDSREDSLVNNIKDKLSKTDRKKAIAQAVSLIYPSAYSVMYTVRGAIKDGVADAIGIAHHLSTTINTKV